MSRISRLVLLAALAAPFGLAGCPAPAEICNDHKDNDGDGLVDCADPDCNADAACTSSGEGEGTPGEGEGTPGEGEGSAGEGEGSAGEGEGSAGEGEGEGEGAVGEGEGEGEGAVGEGEGEGAAGEGEGEGEGEGGGGGPVENTEGLCGDGVDNDGDNLIDCADPDCAATTHCSTDDVGNFDAPQQVSLDLSQRIDINPGTDEDCFSFTLNAPTRLHIIGDDSAFGPPDGRCGTAAFDVDATLYDFAATDPSAPIDVADDVDSANGNFCADLDTAVPAGAYKVCFGAGAGAAGAPLFNVHATILATSLPADEAGDQTSPLAASLPLDQTSNVAPRGDVDCYGFTTNVVGTLDFTTDDGNGGCPGDTALTLFNAAGAQIASNDDADATTTCSHLSVDEDQGAYTICVGAGANNVHGVVFGAHVAGTLTPRLIISEVADQTGGIAEEQWVEIANVSSVSTTLAATTVLSNFINGSPNAADVLDLSGTSIASGATLLVAKNATTFAVDDGRGATQASGLETNGNDAVAIRIGGAILDVYGVPGQDGATQNWSYVHQSAKRNADVTAPVAALDISQWTISTTFTPGTR